MNQISNSMTTIVFAARVIPLGTFALSDALPLYTKHLGQLEAYFES